MPTLTFSQALTNARNDVAAQLNSLGTGAATIAAGGMTGNFGSMVSGLGTMTTGLINATPGINTVTADGSKAAKDLASGGLGWLQNIFSASTAARAVAVVVGLLMLAAAFFTFVKTSGK